MTSSILAGERRFGTARRSGMVVLGKVAVPKPLNLPSQRLENHGLDPSVEIVPKGTLGWGSRPSSSGSNPWGPSSLSPNADGGTGSPSGQPSSGSGTRPSTAGSERSQESSPSVWGQSSRPSSASGALNSNQTAPALLRPRSADTRPGSSQLPHASRPHGSVLRSTNSIDLVSSAAEVTREEAGIALFNQINQALKENVDKVLRSVDGLGARLSQLDSKINNVENTVENLKVSAEYTNGKTDGKLRQLENMLREVQEGINFIKDKQEIADTQFQLAQLQSSKGNNRESQDTKTTLQADPVLTSSSSVPEQPRPPLLVPNAVPSVYHPGPSSNLFHPQTTPTGTAVPEPQNPLPINLLPQSYNLPSGTPEPTYQQYNVPSATSGTTYQQYNVPSANSETTYQHYNVPTETPRTTYQQYNVPPLATSETSYNIPPAHHPQVPPPGSYQQHGSNLLQESQSTQAPQPHPPSGPYYSPGQSLWAHHPEEKPHNYPQSLLHSSSQFHTDSSSQQMRGEPSRSPYPEYPDGYSHTLQQSSFDQMLPYGGSSSHYRSSTMNPPKLPVPSSASGSRIKHSQLPRARILPDALPTASVVEPGSNSARSGNKNSVDEIVDKIAAMGFRRDQARATIKKLADDGQAVDLNVVLDKLMNS